MSNTLFGITVPELNPVGVFPHDPDISFTRGRQWQTQIHRFSPLLEQRFVRASSPQITIDIGFNAMKGAFRDTGKFKNIWEFFDSHRGRGIPFYFYDPVVWTRIPYNSNPLYNYRDIPTTRINIPANTTFSGNPISYSSDTSRFVCVFEEDEMTIDLLEAKLRSTQLKLHGFKG